MTYVLRDVHEYLIRSDKDKHEALREGKKLGLTWVSSSVCPGGYQKRFAKIRHVKESPLVPFAGKEGEIRF